MGLACVGVLPGMLVGIYVAAASKVQRARPESALVYLLAAARTSRRARPRRADVTDQEKQKADELISRLEMQVGQIFPRDRGNASLIAEMIQNLNGLRSLLGLIRPH
jgi:hypothetical protein